MKKKLQYTFFIVAAIFGFCWVDNSLPENSLTNRLVFFSILVLLIIISKLKAIQESAIDHPVFISLATLLGWVIVQFVGLLFAFSRLATIYRIQNTILLIAVFLVTGSIFRKKYRLQIFSVVIAIASIYLVVSLWQLLNIQTFDKDALYNITALNGHKNLFSSFILLLLILLVILGKEAEKKSILSDLICIALFAMLFLLQTRSALLGLGMGIFYTGTFLLLLNKFPAGGKLNPVFAAIGLFSMVACIFLTLPASKSMQSESAQERLKIWKKTIEFVREKPILGYGSGNWPIIFPSKGLPDIKRITEKNIVFTEPHNEYLGIFFDSGLLGLSLAVLFYFLILYGLLQTFRRNPGFSNFLIVSCFIGYLVIMFFDFPNTRIEHIICLGLIAGISYPQNAVICEQKKIPRILPYLISLLLLCSSVFALIRLQGEKYAQDMLTAREGKNDLQVISAAEKAQDFFSVTDNNLVPLPWYSGMTYLRLNDNENALQQFKKAYSINPYNYNVLNNYAVLTYPDNPNLSEKLLNDALKINPAFDEGRKNLISLLIKKNNFAQAKAETERIQDTLLRKKLQSYILFIHQNN